MPSSGIYTSFSNIFFAAVPPDVREVFNLPGQVFRIYSSRLCRLMCGRFSTSRVGLQLSSGLCPKSRAGGHSPEENWRHPLREVENLPHIRRHSREKHLQANPSSSPTRYQARRRQRPSTLSRRPCPVFLLFRVPRIAPLRRN